MSKQFKTARLINKYKATEAAEKLGVSQPTLSAWEGERKSPSIDSLENMADLYGVTTDYLLGREQTYALNPTQPIPAELLPVFHGKPVWSAVYGWMLVNAVDRQLTLPNGTFVPFIDAAELFICSHPFSDTDSPYEKPLLRSEITHLETIWVEPVSPDPDLRKELRGWYQIKERCVQNEYGNRFYLDAYGSKWLAFDKEV